MSTSPAYNTSLDCVDDVTRFIFRIFLHTKKNARDILLSIFFQCFFVLLTRQFDVCSSYRDLVIGHANTGSRVGSSQLGTLSYVDSICDRSGNWPCDRHAIKMNEKNDSFFFQLYHRWKSLHCQRDEQAFEHKNNHNTESNFSNL